MLSTYDIHNKISFWGRFGAIDFWPYVLAFKATAPKILGSKDLNFFQPKEFQILGVFLQMSFHENVEKKSLALSLSNDMLL